MKDMIFEEGELFISDLGDREYAIYKEKYADLKRYAVIQCKSAMTQLQLLEVSDDLNYLMEKYHIERNRIGRIADERG